ncbi:hypothetical protein V8C26DRAFT_386033 [Trichoderma gracile]
MEVRQSQKEGRESRQVQYRAVSQCLVLLLLLLIASRTGCKCDVPPALRTQHVSPPHSSAGSHLASHHVPRKRVCWFRYWDHSS